MQKIFFHLQGGGQVQGPPKYAPAGVEARGARYTWAEIESAKKCILVGSNSHEILCR